MSEGVPLITREQQRYLDPILDKAAGVEEADRIMAAYKLGRAGAVRSEAEIWRQVYAAAASLAGGRWTTRWPGTTFEQGVDAALRWALGDSDEPPVRPS
jgi:hypothetical protein